MAEVRVKLDKARQSLDDAGRIARDSGDAAASSARKRVDDAQRQLDNLWARLKPSLEKGGSTRDRERKVAEAKVTALKTRMSQLSERLEKLNNQSKAAGADELTLEFARQDLERAESVLDTVTRSLDQVEFEAKDPVARFRQEYKAKASNAPLANHQLKAMAAGARGDASGRPRAGRPGRDPRRPGPRPPTSFPSGSGFRSWGSSPDCPRPGPPRGRLSSRDEGPVPP